MEYNEMKISSLNALPGKSLQVYADPLFREQYLGKAVLRSVEIDRGHETVYCKLSWEDDPESVEYRWIARSQLVN
jgi:hypothetical protein